MRYGTGIVALLCALWLALPVAAQQLSGLARLEAGRSTFENGAAEAEITLGLSQPVPFRAFLLDNPPRLVADFREVDFGTAEPQPAGDKGLIRDLRWGRFRLGWSRLVAELSGPARIETAVEETGDAARIVLRLARTQAADFAARTGAPESALWDLPQPASSDMAPHQRQDGSRPLRVVLDPGHGGIDPGAEADSLHEAILTLTFARELKETMTRAGMEVALTRDENVFVPLEMRITLARVTGADLFISLHADALAEGEANGATVYLLDEGDQDAASQKLAERHDRADLLAGVDLTGHDDNVAGVLMDMARVETQPRSVRLAQVMAGAIKGAGMQMHKHPVQRADFSVLKSPDIPSVLLELGFLSSAADRARLLDPNWRASMAQAVTRGVQSWAQADAAEGKLLRQ
ncbi:N-acetylmuramoyl-L-alanine amidase [Paenirhodobacter sp.]|uniref:N-acetylmuramoyl-L-alanine amidase n=1 Tax=Paenirhodobacter sp. TaxID=1965326 RepID=UPI003B500A58